MRSTSLLQTVDSIMSAPRSTHQYPRFDSVPSGLQSSVRKLLIFYLFCFISRWGPRFSTHVIIVLLNSKWAATHSLKVSIALDGPQILSRGDLILILRYVMLLPIEKNREKRFTFFPSQQNSQTYYNDRNSIGRRGPAAPYWRQVKIFFNLHP